MSKFLTGSDLTAAIDGILAEPDCDCAVAFWGHGSEQRLPKGGQGEFRLICNLMSGGTNPYVIEKLKRDNVKHLSTLHAKVYLGATEIIVTSANASVNGLGLEGLEQAKWLEAGAQLVKTDKHGEWFDGLWEQAKTVEDSDVSKAKALWNSRPKISLNSFADFDPSIEHLPMLYWVENVDWDQNVKSVKTQMGLKMNYNDEEIRLAIDDSIEVSKGVDADVFKTSPWTLVWFMGKSGNPLRRPKICWFKPGKIYEKSVRVDGKYRDTAFPSEVQTAPPFEFDSIFVQSFYEVLSKDDFSSLLDPDYKDPWFSDERLKLIRLFWRELKEEYMLHLDEAV